MPQVTEQVIAEPEFEGRSVRFQNQSEERIAGREWSWL